MLAIKQQISYKVSLLSFPSMCYLYIIIIDICYVSSFHILPFGKQEKSFCFSYSKMQQICKSTFFVGGNVCVLQLFEWNKMTSNVFSFLFSLSPSVLLSCALACFGVHIWLLTNVSLEWHIFECIICRVIYHIKENCSYF